MTTTVTFDKSQGVAFIKRAGHIAPHELIKGIQSLTSDASFTGILKLLSDLSGADFEDILSGEIESHEYSAMFASQPEQVAKAKAQAAERAARNKVKSAAVQAALTSAEGGAEAFGGKQ